MSTALEFHPPWTTQQGTASTAGSSALGRAIGRHLADVDIAWAQSSALASPGARIAAGSAATAKCLARPAFRSACSPVRNLTAEAALTLSVPQSGRQTRRQEPVGQGQAKAAVCFPSIPRLKFAG
jgi:hypothetical protein